MYHLGCFAVANIITVFVMLKAPDQVALRLTVRPLATQGWTQNWTMNGNRSI